MKAQDYLTELYRMEELYQKGEGDRQPLVVLSVRFVEDNFNEYNVEEVDAALRDIDVTKCSGYTLVGLIRFSYRARQILPNWYEARDRIHAEFVRREEKADHIMRGLMREPAPVWTEEMIAKVKQDAITIASKMRRPPLLEDDQ